SGSRAAIGVAPDRLWSGRPIIGSPARVTGLFSPRVLRFVRNPGARRGNRRDIVEEVVDLILPVLNEAPAIPWALGRLPSGWDATAGWRLQEVPVPYRRRVGRSKVTGTLSGALRAARDTAAVGRRLSRNAGPR